MDALALLDLPHDYRSKFKANAAHWTLWRAVEAHIRMSETSVVLQHSMRFLDHISGKIDPNGLLSRFLEYMRKGTVIPPDLYRRVVIDRCITPDNAADFVRDGFTPLATLHLSQGWNFVCPMIHRVTAQLARDAGKMLFIVPANIQWCPPSKAKNAKKGAMNTVCPSMEVLRSALFRDNSNAAGERMGLLPIFEGAEVEVLTKMDSTSNILKGTRAVVDRIILDPMENMAWADPDSDAARRGWVTLQRFPRLVLHSIHKAFNCIDQLTANAPQN